VNACLLNPCDVNADCIEYNEKAICICKSTYVGNGTFCRQRECMCKPRIESDSITNRRRMWHRTYCLRSLFVQFLCSEFRLSVPTMSEIFIWINDLTTNGHACVNEVWGCACTKLIGSSGSNFTGNCVPDTTCLMTKNHFTKFGSAFRSGWEIQWVKFKSYFVLRSESHGLKPKFQSLKELS